MLGRDNSIGKRVGTCHEGGGACQDVTTAWESV